MSLERKRKSVCSLWMIILEMINAAVSRVKDNIMPRIFCVIVSTEVIMICIYGKFY